MSKNFQRIKSMICDVFVIIAVISLTPYFLHCPSIDLFSLYALGAIHSSKISGNFGPKLNGSVRSNRKSFEKLVHLLRWSSFPGRTGWNFG